MLYTHPRTNLYIAMSVRTVPSGATTLKALEA